MMQATQTNTTNQTQLPTMVICHCGKEHSRRLEICPFCHCGPGRDCSDARSKAEQDREERDRQATLRRADLVAQQTERQANCAHVMADIPKRGMRGRLHYQRCVNGCGMVITVDTSD
jgi:hypothetical protein